MQDDRVKKFCKRIGVDISRYLTLVYEPYGLGVFAHTRTWRCIALDREGCAYIRRGGTHVPVPDREALHHLLS